MLVVLGAISLLAYQGRAQEREILRTIQEKNCQSYINESRKALLENSESLHRLVHEIQNGYDREVRLKTYPPPQNILKEQEQALQQLNSFLSKALSDWKMLKPPNILRRMHNDYLNLVLFKYVGFLANHYGRVKGEGRLNLPPEDQSHSDELARQATRSLETAMIGEERGRTILAAPPTEMAKLIVATEKEEAALYQIAKRYGFSRETWSFYNCYAEKIKDIAQDVTSYTLESFGIQNDKEQEARLYMIALYTYTYIAEVSGAKNTKAKEAFKPLHTAVFIVQGKNPTRQGVKALSQAFEELVPLWNEMPGITSKDNKANPLDTVLARTVYGEAVKAGRSSDVNLLVHVEDYWEGKLRDLENAQSQCLDELGNNAK